MLQRVKVYHQTCVQWVGKMNFKLSFHKTAICFSIPNLMFFWWCQDSKYFLLHAPSFFIYFCFSLCLGDLLKEITIIIDFSRFQSSLVMNLLEKMSRVGIVWNQNDWLEKSQTGWRDFKIVYIWLVSYLYKKFNETFIFPLAILWPSNMKLKFVSEMTCATLYL